MALTRLGSFAGCSVVRHWQSRLFFLPLGLGMDGSISTRLSMIMDGPKRANIPWDRMVLHSDSTLGSKAWNSSRDDPTLLGYVARHCGKQSQVIVTHTGSLNFPNCPLVDKVIWNICKSNHDRGQHAPLGGGGHGSARDRMIPGMSGRLAGWQGWAMASFSSSSAPRRFRRHRPLSSCRNDNKCGGLWPGALLLLERKRLGLAPCSSVTASTYPQG